MAGLPTGTVTLLFADIEGSTRLLEQGTEQYAHVLADYRRLLREVIGAHGGTEVDTPGDGFFAAFPRARDAVMAAVAAQRGLVGRRWPGAGPLRVRMGLHTGEPEVGDVGYVGLDVHRAARISAAAHGGQILLSQSTREVLEPELLKRVHLRDLGEYSLRDITGRHRLFQVAADGLPADFPRLRTLDALPHNLPRQLTSFVGREREAEEVHRLLATTALLTLTGAGGVGKTRLALHAAAGLLDDFADGMWLVEFGPLRDPELVPQAVASAVDVREQPGRSITATLVDHLHLRQMLLLLDNCEHLIQACAELAASLLRACPRLKILATSREALGVPGEIVWPVPPLSLPDPQRTLSAEESLQYGAVRLFVDRAQAAQPDFRLADHQVLAMTRLCRRLDGIPLAIEMAAARVRAYSVEQIAGRLDDLFHVLSGGRGALPRHRTLRAVLDWSYELLSEEERALLRRLPVFAGGFTLEAVEAVAAGNPVQDAEVLDLLGRLVDKSLVAAHPEEEQVRYRLLEPIRQYALDQLAQAGEGTDIRRRHRDVFLALVESAADRLIGKDQGAWLTRLHTELDNLRGALEWSLEAGEMEAAQRLAAGLGRFWTLRGQLSEGRLWLERAVSGTAPGSPATRAHALRAAAHLAYRQDDNAQAEMLYDQALALFRRSEDRRGLALTLAGLASLAGLRSEGDAHAREVALYKEAIAVSREAGDRWTLSRALGNLGLAEQLHAQYERAAPLLEESLRLARELEDTFGIAHALQHLGGVLAMRGDRSRGAAMMRDAVVLFRGLGARAFVVFAQSDLVVLGEPDDVARAREVLVDALGVCLEIGDRWYATRTLERLAGVAVREGQAERAAVLCGAADAARRALRFPALPEDLILVTPVLDAAHRALGEQAFAAAWSRGSAMTLAQAGEYVLEKAGHLEPGHAGRA